jgi:hypothetical protein
MTLTSPFGSTIKPPVYKWGFLSLLTFVLAQQIYWPQTHKYFHLALLFAFMTFNDMRAHTRRDLRIDLSFAGLVFAASLVSIVEALSGAQAAVMYGVLLTAAGFVAIKSFLDLRIIVARGMKEYIAENHQQIFHKSTRLLEYMLCGISVIVVIAVAYAISHIII